MDDSRTTRRRSWRAMAAALSFFLLYDFSRFLSHQRAIEILNSRVYRDGPPSRVAAFPTAGVSPFNWQGWIERPDFLMRFNLNITEQFDPTAGRVQFKQPHVPAMDAAGQAKPVEVFLGFAQYPVWTAMPVESPPGATEVQVEDWRFPFGAEALVDASNRVVSSTFHYGTNVTRGSIPAK